MKHKRWITVLAVVLLLCTAVGGTLAWMTAKTAPLENKFSVAQVKVGIVEEFSQANGKENIQLRNDGDIKAYLRAAVVVNWEKGGSVVYDSTKSLPVLPTEHSKLGEHWEYIDGYYYYTLPVDPEAPIYLTTSLFDDAIVEPNEKPDGAHLQVTILAEGIQAMPDNAIKEAWKVDPNDWVAVSPVTPDEGGGEG